MPQTARHAGSNSRQRRPGCAPASACAANVRVYRLLCATAARCARLPRTLGLDRRARNGTVRTEHTAIAGLGPQRHATAGASIEEPACIGRHRFQFLRGAMRASDDGLKDHGAPTACNRYPRLRLDTQTSRLSSHWHENDSQQRRGATECRDRRTNKASREQRAVAHGHQPFGADG